MAWKPAIFDDPLRRRWPTLVNVMLSRLALLGVLLLALTVLLPRSEGAFYVFIGLAFVITIPYAYWLRTDASAQQTAAYQFVLDVVIITGLVHFTGGIRSELHILYLLVILAAGIIVSGRLALQIAILGIFLYAAVILLEMHEILVYRGSDPFPYANQMDVIRELMMRIVIFAFFTAAASFIADRCFFQDKQLKRLQTVGELIFDNVAMPLLGVHADGQVVLANTAASRLFQRDAAALKAHSILSLFQQPPASILQVAKTPTVCLLRRGNDETFPCIVELEKAKIPALEQDVLGLGSGAIDLYLIAFNDLSRFLVRDKERDQDTRRHTAVGVVAEMAHVVRNPLTAIMGAGELLAQTAGLAAQRRQDVSANDWAVISSLCEIISDETTRLDRKVQDFMDCAARDPEKLVELTKDASEWSRRVPIFGEASDGKNSAGG